MNTFTFHTNCIAKARLLFFRRLLRQLLAPASIAVALTLLITNVYAQRFMERLDRGVVAVRTSSSQVYIGWRMFGTDPSTIAFNVYRGSTKINATPITNSTNLVDNTTTNSSYSVKPVINGVEQAASDSTTPLSQQFLNVPLQIPGGGTTPDGVAYTYRASDCSVGDLDGDGQYEIVLKWDPTNSKDNAQAGYTGNVFIDAYQLDGTRMWRIDLGRNIRAGAHYSQIMVYDFDSDGKAELICKTADGTKSGTGQVIGSSSADYRNSSGYILSGPEFLTVFNGQTGAAMATTNFIVPRGNVGDWGDTYGNRVDRFNGGVAYLDGVRPSVIMCRGYYTRTVVVAWDWRNGQLTQRWRFDTRTDSNPGAPAAGFANWEHMGNHQLTVADIDSDGKDEILFGAIAINENGKGMYTTGIGHGDAYHVSDMDPDRAGLEVYGPHEVPSLYGNNGSEMHDARTGAVIWGVSGQGADVGRGCAFDIDPRTRGYEAWSARGGLFSCKGVSLGSATPSMNFGVWWDADFLRELLDNNHIDEWDYTNSVLKNVLTATECGSNNSSKATPCLSGDIFGDWREEVIWRTNDNTSLHIYTTTAVTTHRLYTLMHDTQYREAIAWQNSAYNQPPHPSFYLGDGMSTPPTPNIQLTGSGSTGGGGQTSITIQENTTGFCSVNGTIDSNNAGFTGTGFANANNAAGSGVTWSVNAGSSGTYSVSWRYANGSGADRPGKVLVNGATAISSVSFPATTDWVTWTTVSANVSLTAGANTIRLESTGATGLGNIDQITITGANPQATTCPAGARLSVSESKELVSKSERVSEGAQVYPNPSYHSFMIRANGAFKYMIYDQLGKEMETGGGIDEAAAGTLLKPSVYILSVKTELGTHQFRLIKK